MGKAKPHSPVKLFTAITFAIDMEKDAVLTEMANLLSRIEFKSDVYNFSQFTDYYQQEMGQELLKQIVVFADIIEPESIPAIKLCTNDFEQRYSEKGKRLINVDPGYICAAKVILATTKDYAHRIYLGRGIYGDIHLCYHQQSFQVQPWTYPDYRQQHVINFFNQIRNEYIQQLRTPLV